MTTSPTTVATPTSPSRYNDYLNKDGLSDETRDLISNLPREKGWIIDNMYLFEGFWFWSRHLQGLIACQKHFQAQDTDIVLASSPKCGATWLKAMTFALLNRPSPGADHPLLSTNPHCLVPFLEINLYYHGDNKIPDLSTFTSPRLLATHIPVGSLPRSVKDSSCKIVYVCRNPKDTVVSAWHFANKLTPKEDQGSLGLEDTFRMFCDGVSPFGPYWDHVMGYWEESLRSSHKVLFLKYEDIKEQPAVQLRRIAEFLERPFLPEEESKGMVDEIVRLCSFDHLRNLEVNKIGTLHNGEPKEAFFMKGAVGDSGNFLTPQMIEELDHITELKFRDSKLKF